jgi:anti-sigma regulatory factor (Ser/Thr protein kinase)
VGGLFLVLAVPKTALTLPRVPTAVPERESTATHEFRADPVSVPEARRVTCEFAGDTMSEEQLSKLSLAVTELMANAVRHSGSSHPITLILGHKDSHFCVRVVDGGAGLVPAPGAMAPEPGAGFGLFLVEQLTKRWGVTREDQRTRVWFEIDYAAEGADGIVAADAPCDSL